VIPQVIHQVWLGDAPVPKDWMMSWFTVPGYEYRLWREADFRWLHNQELFDHFLQRKMFDAACDVARVEILHKHGGLYVDADMERVGMFELGSCLMLSEEPSAQEPFLVSNAFMACLPGELLFRRYVAALSRIKPERVFPNTCWDVTGPGLLTRLTAFHRGAVILPPWLFTDKPQYGQPPEPARIAIHHFSSTTSKWKNAPRHFSGQAYPVKGNVNE
jgi:mannosyltransferase OCH1-like enzyme